MTKSLLSTRQDENKIIFLEDNLSHRLNLKALKVIFFNQSLARIHENIQGLFVFMHLSHLWHWHSLSTRPLLIPHDSYP